MREDYIDILKLVGTTSGVLFCIALAIEIYISVASVSNKDNIGDEFHKYRYTKSRIDSEWDERSKYLVKYTIKKCDSKLTGLFVDYRESFISESIVKIDTVPSESDDELGLGIGAVAVAIAVPDDW